MKLPSRSRVPIFLLAVSSGALTLVPDVATAAHEYRVVDEYIVHREYRKAETALTALARDGETEAMYRLAGLYRGAPGFERRLDESARLYADAAALGHVPSMFLAGQCFERGIGVPRDPMRARAWYERAAESGDERARSRLATLVDEALDPWQALATAGDAPTVLDRLAAADVLAVDARGRTLLMVAVQSRAPAAVSALLARGAPVDAVDRNGRTALFYAVDAGAVGIARALLAAGADANRIDAAGNAPLHLAAAAGSLPLVDALLAGGARADAPNTGGWTALDIARNKDHAALAARLDGFVGRRTSVAVSAPQRQIGVLQKSSQFAGLSELAIAVWQGDADLVSRLLAEQAPDAPDADGHTSLYWAVDRGHAAILDALLDAGKDPDADRSRSGSLLHVAVMHGRPAMIAALLRAGADEGAVDERGATALLLAIERGARAGALELAHPGAPLARPDEQGRTPLIAAADRGDGVLLDRLLGLGARPDGFDALERSALWYACAAEDPALVERLLAHGAGFEGDRDGVTPLHRAIGADRPEAAMALLAAGHPAGVRTSSGSTPLHLAASRNGATVVRALIARGVDVDPRDGGGDTPLHKAAAMGHFEAAQLLLDAGAKPGVRNDRRENFFDLASRRSDARWAALADSHRSELGRLLGG